MFYTFAEDENLLDADQQMIQSYEEAFARIQEVTHETSIHTIVDNFVKNEEENFALFNYVNELNSEVSQSSESSLLPE